jgi:hypothetical protein
MSENILNNSYCTLLQKQGSARKTAIPDINTELLQEPLHSLPFPVSVTGVTAVRKRTLPHHRYSSIGTIW